MERLDLNGANINLYDTFYNSQWPNTTTLNRCDATQNLQKALKYYSLTEKARKMGYKIDL